MKTTQLLMIWLALALAPLPRADAEMNFFSDFNDSIPDWDIDTSIGSAAESNGQLAIQAQFHETGGIGRSLTGIGWAARQYDATIRDGQTQEYRVDLIRASGNDVLARIEQSEELKKSNEALKTKYASNFQGYPTTVILDSSGKKLGEKVGYVPGGPKAFIAEIEKITGKKS